MDDPTLSLVILIVVVCIVLIYGFKGGQFIHNFVLTGPTDARNMAARQTAVNAFPAGTRNMYTPSYMGRPPTTAGNAGY